MLSYILKRLLLMVPTLFGALAITFVVIQFVPGGPVEQLMAEARANQRGGGESGYRASRDNGSTECPLRQQCFGTPFARRVAHDGCESLPKSR